MRLKERAFGAIGWSVLSTASLAHSTAWAGLEVHGHRGARSLAPENTIASFERALAGGATAIELDVRVSRDGELMVIHDAKVPAKLCLGPGGQPVRPEPKVRELSAAALKSFDCGSVTNPDFPEQQPAPGATIPTLREVFDWLNAHPDPRARDIWINVELKDNAQPSDSFTLQVAEEVDRAGLSSRVVIQSFLPRHVVAYGKIRPGTRRSILVRHPAIPLLPLAKILGVQVISPVWFTLSPREVRKLRRHGFKVIPWTVNCPKAWKHFVRSGVDGIITDDPGSLNRWLDGQKLPTAP